MPDHHENNFVVEQEKISGIVSRITFHSVETGYTVLKVNSFQRPNELITVIVYQTKVFAGATLEFFGTWVNHPTFGLQFKAVKVVEKKPATAHALEKYLGSGLIKGVGPVTAKKIVSHFKERTLDVFDHSIDQLTEVPGIAKGKLQMIRSAWTEHQEIRAVMLFLQAHDISTLFAVKIYKTYGNQTIEIVKKNPYKLAEDIYGIGFFSADKLALKLGLVPNAPERIKAAIEYVLQNARQEGHCYLTGGQISKAVKELLSFTDEAPIESSLAEQEQKEELKIRLLPDTNGMIQKCYYAQSIYYDEQYISLKVKQLVLRAVSLDQKILHTVLEQSCRSLKINLSEEQYTSVLRIAKEGFSILTGGPGCGKTTTTKALVNLLQQLGKNVLLAAPTGRASQRMSEVIGREAKTLHRLLEFDPAKGGFKKNDQNPLQADFLIIDESSMLDVHLAAALLRAVPLYCQVVFIGDVDQLPAVGAGNVLKDIINSGVVPCYKLTKIFRQAQESLIIAYAHQINRGLVPKIESPFHHPGVWIEKKDCLFIDSEEATREQLHFIAKVKRHMKRIDDSEQAALNDSSLYLEEPDFSIPDKFSHVDIDALLNADHSSKELIEVLKSVHPWSSLHYGFAAGAMIERLYGSIIPKYFGKAEIQILSPMTKGSLGTISLNKLIQQSINPQSENKSQLELGGRIYRAGDRIIQKRNNYDLNVFNGDIGTITSVDNEEMTMSVQFNIGKETKEVFYEKDHLLEIDLAYAITIHKSQGSEFEVVIIPLATQHFTMLFRNLIYTALTRAKKLAIFVGSRKALAMAVHKQNTSIRQTALTWLLKTGLV
jgi:exodeoxyribonuclease V alpha subunit